MRIIKGKHLKHFYRYRPSYDYEMDTLDKKQIYLCKPKVYEDKEDCKIKTDDEDLIRHCLRHSKEIYKATNELICKVKKEIKYDSRWLKLMNNMRNDCLVACFTEAYNNEYMWTNYANNSTGICVEYDSLELLDCIGQIIGDICLYDI